jgi:hypothetical protein
MNCLDYGEIMCERAFAVAFNNIPCFVVLLLELAFMAYVRKLMTMGWCVICMMYC